MLKEIRNNSKDIYNKSKYYNWVVCILIGIVVSGILALTPMIGLPSVLIVLILVMPFLFAGMILLFNISKVKGWTLTFKSLAASFILYFTPHFKSTFLFWKSFGFSMIVFIVSSIIFGITGYCIINNVYPRSLTGFIDQVVELIKNGKFTLDNLNALMSGYSYALDPFNSIMMLPAIGLTSLTFIYLVGLNLHRFYYKVYNPPHISKAGELICKMTFRKYKKTFIKEYLLLSWPLFVLFVIGFSLGGGLFTFYTSNTDYLACFALLIGFASTIFYLPFYFANMESMYLFHKEKFTHVLDSLAERMKKMASEDEILKILDKVKEERPESNIENNQEETKQDNNDSGK